MRREQSILVGSTLITGIVMFFLGWTLSHEYTQGQAKKIPAATSVTQDAAFPSAPVKIRNIDEVWKRLRESYYDAAKLDLPKLEWSALQGFVSGIGDDYTVYMTPEESKDFEQGLEGHLEGIGAELEVSEGKLLIVTPLKNSPAEQAGLLSGDIIFKINDKFAEDMTFYEAITTIRGKKGTAVNLTIIRKTKPEPFEVTLIREEVQIESVEVSKVEEDFLQVTINQFNERTKNEFNDIVQKVLLEKPKGLIVDVRGNGGGYLNTSIDIVSEFIAGKKPAVIIKQRDEKNNSTEMTNGSGRLADIPVVVLINGGSASAAEIFAGAMQDYKRGILIGEKTFGKGSVQEISALPDGSSLRMTVAKWFTPNNRSIDDVGIAPDIEVKMTDEDFMQKKDPQLARAVEYLKTFKKK